MKNHRSVKDPWTKNVYADKKKHSGLKRNLVDSEREAELDNHLSHWKNGHVELDKEYKLDR